MSRHQVLKSALDRISSCHLSVITSCFISNINQIAFTDKPVAVATVLLASFLPTIPVDYQTRQAPESIGRDILHLKKTILIIIVTCYGYCCLSKLYYTTYYTYYHILYYTYYIIMVNAML